MNAGHQLTSARLRLLYLVPPTRGFAGIERVTHELARQLQSGSAGAIEVVVAWGRRYEEPDLIDAPYRSIHLQSRTLAHFALQVRRLTARLATDFIVCPQVEASTLVALLHPIRARRELVCHIHGNPAVEFAGGSGRTRLLFRLFSIIAVRRVLGLLAVSPDLGRYLERRWGRATRWATAVNPVRTLARRPSVPGRDARRFVNIGRLAEQKDHRTLLRAFASALQKDPTLRLDIVGSGPLRGDLERLHDQLGLGEAVALHGHVANPGEFLARASVYVSAARWEGFGLTIVEALQFGLPVVSTDCDFGPRELLTEPSLGALVEVGDAAGLARAMLDQAGRASSKRDVEARVLTAARFAPPRAAAEHLRALANLLNPEDRRGPVLIRAAGPLEALS